MIRTEQENINPGPGDQTKDAETTNGRDRETTQLPEMDDKVKDEWRGFYEQSASNQPGHLENTTRDLEE